MISSHSSSVVIFAVGGLFCLVAPMRAQSTRPERISADDGRPMLSIIAKLEAMYGWAITYEDPPYEHDRELVDRSDPEFVREHPGKRRLFPSGGHFDFGFDAPNIGFPESRSVLVALLEAYRLSGNPGIYALHSTGSTWHIEPGEILRRDGRKEAAQSILDQAITFPMGRRTSLETFQLIIAGLSGQGKAKVALGVFPVNSLSQSVSTEGPQGEPAKAVLLRVLEDLNKASIEAIGEPRRYVWQIMYEPDSKTYYFNMHVVAIEETMPLGGTRRRPI